MALTKKELIDIISCDVQAVVLEKVQSFTDGWAKEFQKLVIEVKAMGEHDSNIIRQLNDHERLLNKAEETADKVDKLFFVFYENGFSRRFTELCENFQEFLSNRYTTCPVSADVRAIKAGWDAMREDAVAHAEGKLRTRKDDRYKTMVMLISLAAMTVSLVTLLTKLLGWW